MPENIREKLLGLNAQQWNEWRNENPHITIILKNEDLSKADLQGKILDGACLYRANLEEALLCGAGLANADLRKANLRGANLSGATLTEARLQSAILTKANLNGAALQKVNLKNAFMDNANLHKANLSEAFLRKCVLKGADLREVNAIKCDMWKANLSKATLEKGDFSEADLRNAIWKTSIFNKACLKDAKFYPKQAPEKKWEEYDGPQIVFNAWHQKMSAFLWGKRIAVLGPKGVGKTCLIHFLTHGTTTGKYTPTLGREHFCHQYSGNGITVNLKLTDVSGDFESHRDDWRTAFTKCQKVIYIFNAHLLRVEDDTPHTRREQKNRICIEEHLCKILDWANEDKRDNKITIHLVGTHCDQDELYKTMGPDAYKQEYFDDFLKITRSVEKSGLHLANLSTGDEAQKLMEEIFAI